MNITNAACPVRHVCLSSFQHVSRTYWLRFSIIQWRLTSLSSVVAPASLGERFVTEYSNSWVSLATSPPRRCLTLRSTSMAW